MLRSFGLMEELSQAQAINKCLGSSSENAVGVTVDGVVNPEGLRFDDEFVRHKLLDAIGDLYLWANRYWVNSRGTHRATP